MNCIDMVDLFEFVGFRISVLLLILIFLLSRVLSLLMLFCSWFCLKVVLCLVVVSCG